MNIWILQNAPESLSRCTTPHIKNDILNLLHHWTISAFNVQTIQYSQKLPLTIHHCLPKINCVILSFSFYAILAWIPMLLIPDTCIILSKLLHANYQSKIESSRWINVLLSTKKGNTCFCMCTKLHYPFHLNKNRFDENFEADFCFAIV